jgi:peptide chain release factor subunit 1
MTLSDQLDRLAAFEQSPYPVVSLYLNTQPGPTGKDQFQRFVRKEFAGRSRTYPDHSPERDSLNTDLEKILRYLQTDLQPSANGVAIFACSAGELFEAVQMTAPIARHSLYIGDQPHLYPLARIESQYPRYAAVLTDTNSARILVVATGEVVNERELKGVKTRRTSQGGSSQARFQRHVENFHLQHVKEVVDVLDRIVQDEGIEQIVVAGDEVVTPLLREQLPKRLADRIVDHVRIEAGAPANQILRMTLEAMKRSDKANDAEAVDSAVGAYRAGGLGVVGPEETLEALIQGQVDELLINASVRDLHALGSPSVQSAANDVGIEQPAVEVTSAGEAAESNPQVVRMANELIAKARQTSARIRFIEDSTLLAPYGGVAALLRFRGGVVR